MSSSSTNLSTSAISLEGLIAESQANKARLLHYYPLPAVDASDESVGTGGKGEGEEVDDSLCGTHIDHSLLTGLCECRINSRLRCVLGAGQDCETYYEDH